MKKDPKKIVTPFAFNVHPELLGLPLATPKRRLTALLLDLIIASILGSLGNFILAVAVTILFFWIAIRTRTQSVWRNIMRFSMAGIGSLLIFVVVIGVLEGSETTDTDEEVAKELAKRGIVTSGASVDWKEFSKEMANIDHTNQEETKKAIQKIEKKLEKELPTNAVAVDSSFYNDLPDTFSANLLVLSQAIKEQDQKRADSLRSQIASVIARPELSNLENEIELLGNKIIAVEKENEMLQDPSIYRTLKAGFNFMGLTLGWVGIYFICCLAFFKGKTIGKKFLNLQVRRLDNKDIGLWYSFERFGGYAAGLATGLLGFFQIYWDPNRQGIHDKIAGTVVVDLRDSKRLKTKKLRDQILEEENLLN
ncbi:RDD family protein [Fodinibius saliphilus]|uniref:RDD family protein n=1 Tax=Fodinibius saliphilus TaxID=1920650 RepID=UPI001BB172E0|nr:RDD family protein [Fodinibius saliphilus]